jgi:hypothetical protein
VFACSGCLYGRERCICVLVAGTRTVLQLAHCVEHFRGINFLMRIGLEFRCVTARTIRLVSCKLPSNHFVIRLVTRGARETVVGFVSRRYVRVSRGGHPRRRAMASVA